MAERISLVNSSDKQFSEAIDTALRYLRSGEVIIAAAEHGYICLLYTSPSPRDVEESRMPSSA